VEVVARRGGPVSSPVKLPPPGLAGRAMLAAAGPLPPTVELPFGPTSRKALRLILLPDGFTTPELPAYQAAVTAFLDRLKVMAPFVERLDAILPVRVDLASDESGVDDPATGASVDTRFGAAFGVGALRRLIQVDQSAVRQVADKVANGKAYAAVVIVNTAEYGGSGGKASVFSLLPAAGDIAVHELGHSLFGLSDEYSSPGVAGQPDGPNVTKKPDRGSSSWSPRDRDKLKWRGQLSAGLAVPTFLNPNCGVDTPAPPTPGVGLFEGAKYETCGYFRPAASCKMRELTADFCPVCQDVIRRKLASYI
jgi:hypothetical protein